MKTVPVTKLIISSLLVMCMAGIAYGQSALDGFDPQATSTVGTIALQQDGKILLGGSFNQVLGVPRNGIARLNSDGTLDSAFNPNAAAQSFINVIALQSDGKILVSGYFGASGTIGGQTRGNMARLDPATGTADSFNPSPDQPPFAVVVQPDGKILIGGMFTEIGLQQTRNFIARLDPVTGVADSFNANIGSGEGPRVDAIALQPDGKVLIGGYFTSVGGQPRKSFVRLNADGTLDMSFNPNLTGLNDSIDAITVQPDGKILVSGSFSFIGGQPRYALARLEPLNGTADSFNPGIGEQIVGIVVQSDGRILVNGSFFGLTGGQPRNRIARLDPITGQADSFDPNPGRSTHPALRVEALVPQPDGKIIAGGYFTAFTPNGEPQVPRNYAARLEADGGVEQILNLNAIGAKIVATAMQADGKILIGGVFKNILGVQRDNMARLNADGTLDQQFDPSAGGEVDAIAVELDGSIMVSGAFTTIGQATRSYVARLDGVTGGASSFNGANPNDRVTAMAVQPGGKVLLGGAFTNIGGQIRNHIARLDPISGLADIFDPNANGAVNSIVWQSDGKILVGGSFSNIGGASRGYLARLDAAGVADPFAPLVDGPIDSITVQPDGSIMVTGQFTHINGEPRKGMALLDGVTGAVAPFDANANGPIDSIVTQSDGKIVASGSFTNIGGQAHNYLGRMDSATGIADNFDASADNVVHSLGLQADGKILAGGEFGNIGGQSRNIFGRLVNDTLAGQELNATASTITWSRAGSSPQFSRVTFEMSSDNASYTSLGNGTFTGDKWTSSGVKLPIDQNVFIRARGYYRSGEHNASESIVQAGREVFLFGPTGVVSRKMHGSAGTFDIDLPLSGTPGVECRSGGASGDYQIVFTFVSPVVFDGAVIKEGAGSVSGTNGSGTSSVSINLTGIANGQRVTVALLGASHGSSKSDFAVPMDVLVGDTSGNGVVNATDIGQAKSNSGQAISVSNFRSDIDANGSINATDIGLVKAQSGTYGGKFVP